MLSTAPLKNFRRLVGHGAQVDQVWQCRAVDEPTVAAAIFLGEDAREDRWTVASKKGWTGPFHFSLRSPPRSLSEMTLAALAPQRLGDGRRPLDMCQWHVGRLCGINGVK